MRPWVRKEDSVYLPSSPLLGISWGSTVPEKLWFSWTGRPLSLVRSRPPPHSSLLFANERVHDLSPPCSFQLSSAAMPVFFLILRSICSISSLTLLWTSSTLQACILQLSRHSQESPSMRIIKQFVKLKGPKKLILKLVKIQP